ncbi:MAG: helix-turn-helix transcriptional regulator [Clostridia bacterium]|nr:helix-turn-helix transcriptional regulator [Clostridia bacterium]
MKIYTYNGKSNLCGPRIRMERERQGLTQEQLAARLQVVDIQLNQKAISRIENGERLVADFELKMLAQVLCVTAEQLLS